MRRLRTSTSVATTIVLFLASCGSPTAVDSPNYSNLSSATLWHEFRSATDTKQIMLIEAELASRGETQSNGLYIGQKTSRTVGRHVYARTDSITGDKNCSDFSSSIAAQKFFLATGGPTRDPNGLDRDGDGNACEWGKILQRSLASYRKPITRIAPVRTLSTGYCHVGPRGGTYTITASGNKNYDGC